jgi:hypothetical protein
MELILHIGLPKTATTALQEWMTVHRERLLEHGFWVPDEHVKPHRIAVEFIKDPERAAMPDVARIKRQLEVDPLWRDLKAELERGQASTCILSSEYFQLCDPAIVREALQHLGFSRIRVIVFLRRQDRLIESGFNQEVKEMGFHGPFLLPGLNTHFDWSSLVGKWSAAFGRSNMDVLIYDTLAREKRILQSFLDTLGVRFESGNDKEALASNANESLPANILEFKRLANKLGEFGLSAFLAEAAKQGITGPQFRMSIGDARECLDIYAESNRQVAKEYVHPDSEWLFDEEDLLQGHAGQNMSDDLPPATVAQLLALYMKQNDQRIAALEKRLNAVPAAVLKRIDAVAADKIAHWADVDTRNLRFGNHFLLRGVSVLRGAGGVKLELAWEALRTQQLGYWVAVHVNGADGELLRQADYPQDASIGTVEKGALWRDEVAIGAAQLEGATRIGIALYCPKRTMLAIDKGPRDWDGRRLLLRLPAASS